MTAYVITARTLTIIMKEDNNPKKWSHDYVHYTGNLHLPSQCKLVQRC